jgi:Fic family protein
MEKLLRWFEEAQKEGSLHPLLIVGVFIVWFLAIHPFQDGNGRLSRVLTTLMLLRFGYAYAPYSSLESVIEESKGGYYAALRQTQQTLKADKPDFEAWLVFFLRCLVHQKDRLARKVEAEQKVPMNLSELAVQIVNLLAVHSSITVASVVTSTGANRNTVKAALKNLARQNLIVQRGKGRGVHYTLV